MATAVRELSHSTELLNSWKEIAAYLNRCVRTVQRWEIELGLPVRRPRAKNRSAVMAFRAEIDAWTRGCPVASIAEQAVPPRTDVYQVTALSSLILESRGLQNNLRRLRKDVNDTMNTLIDNIRKVTAQTLPPPTKLWQSILSEDSSTTTVA